MKIVIDIPDADDAGRMIGGGCRKWNRPETVKAEKEVDVPDPDPKAKKGATIKEEKIVDVPNPQSKVDFVKARLVSYWLNEVRIQEREEAKVVSDGEVDKSIDKIEIS